MTFEEALYTIKEKFREDEYDDEYFEALDVMSVMWDQDVVDRLNKLAPPTIKIEEGAEIVIMLFDIRTSTYIIFSRDRSVGIHRPYA